MKIALAFMACYIMGAIPFGLIIGKVTRGVDIRDFGSGNIGFSNALRTLGPGPASIVFVGDIAKGLFAVLLCRHLVGAPWADVVGGFLSILGHTFSVFLKFQGGKAVSTSLGMIVGFNPVIAGISFVIWALLVGVTRYISVASPIAAISVLVMMYFAPSLLHTTVPVEYQAISFVAALLIVVRHRSNYVRLINGTETKFGQKVKLEGN